MPQAAVIVAAVAAVAATAVSTASQVSAAKSNAKAADWEAESIAKQTEQAQADERLRNKELLSKQTALAGASGIATTSGSPLENALQSAFEGEMNVLKIGYTGKLNQSAAKYQAALARASITPTIIGGALKATSSIASMYGSMGGTVGANAASGAAASSTGGSSLLSSYGNQYGAWSPSRYHL